jgi:hypothetical protein
VSTLAVDDQRQLLAGNEAADPEVLNRELVFAVGRKVVRATMPPRVPNGMPSRRWFCDASLDAR